jgi:N-methylhydantoinase A
LAKLGFRNQVSLMLSHGGIGPATQVAEEFPVRMIESGPAAGAIAAAYFARQALARPDAIAFDMGGTTAKMSLIRDGQPSVTHEYEVAHVHRFKHGSGLPLQISAVELLEIGAGGGSIAQVSELGLLTVGPRSAGAAPGPACYGRGGDRPTVTDADLLLGYLDGEHFLGGAMKLDAAAAATAMTTHLGGTLGMSADALAWGIHDVVNEHMAAATRAHAVEKGVDLRQFAMIAFGGAGPVHAYALARKLGLTRVICPFGAGVASSIGCLVAAPAVDLATAFFGSLDRLDWSAAAARVEEMRREGERMLADLVERAGAGRLDVSLDLRCEGQGYAVTVPSEAARLDAGSISRLKDGFARRYVELYGHKPPDVPLEVLALRARVEHPSRSDRLQSGSRASTGGDPRKGERRAYFDAAGGFVPTRVYDRYRLPIGQTLPGPAIVEERETSIVIGPDATFHVDPAGHVVIDIAPAGATPGAAS